MKETTKKKLLEEIVNFGLEALKTDYSLEELKKAFPFHAVFFSDEALIAFKNERSLVTKMGMKLYPRLAEIIARDKYNDVHLDKAIIGKADAGMINAVNRILDELRAGKRKPDAEKEWREIINSATGELRTERVIADLYIGDYKHGPLFMEIKSPKPNLDICIESKKKILYFKIILLGKNPQGYLAFPYNPYITREKYGHGFVRKILDINREVLIGDEMWDKIGGDGTYNQLLEILEEAKKIIQQKLRK